MDGILQSAFGRNIRRWRRTQGLSQERFGEEVGWHRTFVGAVERGERNLTLKTVERICEQLGVHPLDLLWDREHVAFRADAAGGHFEAVDGATLAAADGPASASAKGAGAKAPARRPRR